MKTLQQFLELAERYYKPDEKLSSGKTPYEKAKASSDRQTEKYYSKPDTERSLKDIRRLAKHNRKINQNVSHGADNPNFNLHWDPSGEVQVSGHSDNRMRVKNTKSNIAFVISNTGKKTKEGKPVHDVEWYNTGKLGPEMDDKEKKNTLRSARDTWTKHISHRLPHGSVIRNFPISNPGSNPGSDSSSNRRYTRASLYSRIAGFGERNPISGYQYASVDREPSPRQKAKGKKKTNPMSPYTATFDSLPEEFRDLTPERKETEIKRSWNGPMKTFQEFLELSEKYYAPDEKLPSNKTPLSKAVKKQEKRESEIGPNSNIRRMNRHAEKIETKVKHGADNPNYNATVSNRDDDEIRVDSDGTDYLTVHHKPSKVTYNVVKQPGPGNIHSIEWNHERGHRKTLLPSERNDISRDARRVWDQHVSHRLPHGATLHNKPAREGLGRIYKRSGFGNVDSDNDQFARIGREKSPKQRAKGKKSRLTPLDPKETKKKVSWY